MKRTPAPAQPRPLQHIDVPRARGPLKNIIRPQKTASRLAGAECAEAGRRLQQIKPDQDYGTDRGNGRAGDFPYRCFDIYPDASLRPANAAAFSRT